MKRYVALLLLMLSLLAACSDGQGDTPQTPNPSDDTDGPSGTGSEQNPDAAQPDEPGVPPAPALYPEAPGTAVFESEKAKVDYSNAADGYITVWFSGDAQKRSKAQVTADATYTYDVDSNGAATVLPLNMGDTTYQIKIFEQVVDTSYAVVLDEQITVTLNSELTPYLYPSAIIRYDADSATVAKGLELTANAQSDLQRVQAVYSYAIENIVYDYEKAETVQPGYVPDPDETLATGTGICYDYAALLATMLRTQGVPTRLIMGYLASGEYHAWNEVYLENQGWVTMAIYAEAGEYRLVDPTIGAQMDDDDMASFLEDGANYVVKYRY